jgi:uncharacterized protein (DUF58 family)
MRRGGALVLGGVVLGAAIVFASRPLGVVGLGLLAAGVLSRAWSALASVPADVRMSITPDPATEGDEVALQLSGRRRVRVPGATTVVSGTFDRLGAFECRLRGKGRSLRGDVALGVLPRGRFTCSGGVIEVRDPLGLDVRSRPLAGVPGVMVRPRLVELDSLFSDAGRRLDDGRRLLLRRTAGFDLHSVREYEQGESLRRVHWPTSAKRGQLMVKELEDAPRESVVVLLDCDPAGQAGEPPHSSFDAAVRAAGSLVRAHVVRGRRAALTTTRGDTPLVRASSLEGDFQAVLATLAAADADARQELGRFLANPHTAVTGAGELIVVTAVLQQAAVRRILDVGGRRLVSVVWVDAPSFVGRPTRGDTGLLRLSSAGIPVAVVRSGDDLRSALQLPRRRAGIGG